MVLFYNIQFFIIISNIFGVKDNLFITVGCHPTRCNEFEKNNNPDEYFDGLLKLIQENDKKVLAVGEFGLGILLYIKLKLVYKFKFIIIKIISN